MKERLLGDFSRKNLKSDNILDKVLNSEKLIDKTSRFREVSRYREDNIYKYRVMWLCQSVVEPRELMKIEELKSHSVDQAGGGGCDVIITCSTS